MNGYNYTLLLKLTMVCNGYHTGFILVFYWNGAILALSLSWLDWK